MIFWSLSFELSSEIIYDKRDFFIYLEICKKLQDYINSFTFFTNNQ